MMRNSCARTVDRTYTLGLVDHLTWVVWWLDYLPAVDEATLLNSLRRWYDIIGYDGVKRYVTSVTIDGWQAAHNAWESLSRSTWIAECILHPMFKLREVLAIYRRRYDLPDDEIRRLARAFWDVLTASSPIQFVLHLKRLPSPFSINELLVPRRASLEKKVSSLTVHLIDPLIARTTSCLDAIFKRLDRKVVSMQTFRTPDSATATLNAWAIAFDFHRFLPGAERAGHAPVELAGLDLQGIPWLQFVQVKLSLALCTGQLALPQT